MAAKDAVGRHGEQVVATRLREAGWEILDRNWRCDLGELDIVAVDGRDLVAVEVKTRRTHSYGPPQEAVTRRKLARLRQLTAAWLSSQQRHFGAVRIDVCAVTLPRSGPALVEHLRGVE